MDEGRGASTMTGRAGGVTVGAVGAVRRRTGWWVVHRVLLHLGDGSGDGGAGDLRLKGYSYLWMHPIWGVGLLLGENLMLCCSARGLSRATRALVAWPCASRWSTPRARCWWRCIGRCPWDYSASPWSVNGLIRLDYAPFWWLCGLLYEPLGRFIRRCASVSHARAEPEASRPELWPSREAPQLLI